MSLGQDFKQFEPTEKEYVLTCKIVPHEVSYDDQQSQGSMGNMTRQCIALVPVENDQMYAFFAAWLGVPGKLVEVLIKFGHPFHQYARAAILHPRSQNPKDAVAVSFLEEHHLFLMNYGLEQIILGQKHLHGKEIQVTTCKESDDHPDGAPTDGVGMGDELFAGTRKSQESVLPPSFQSRIVPPGSQLIADPAAADRHGRKFPPLKG